MPPFGAAHRGGWAALLLLTFALGYAGSAAWPSPPVAAQAVASGWDERIPCVGPAVWVYACGLVLPLAPAWLLPRQHFMPTVAAYAALIISASALFVLVPVHGQTLRAACAAVQADPASAWALALLHRVDPPRNLFPSLHIGFATLASLCMWQARARGRGLVACLALAQWPAVCAVKQHFLADALAGAVLAVLVYATTRAMCGGATGAAAIGGESIQPSSSK